MNTQNVDHLVSRCKSGDGSAWKSLIDKFSSLIYNIAYRFTGSVQRAEDLTQEIFLKAYRGLDSYKQNGNFKNGLCRIGKNHCIDDYRKRRNRDRDISIAEDESIPVESGNPFESFSLKERGKILDKCLDRLPEHMRVALIMRDVEGYSYRDISEKLDVALGTVKSRINRARIKMAEMINKIDGEDDEL